MTTDLQDELNPEQRDVRADADEVTQDSAKARVEAGSTPEVASESESESGSDEARDEADIAGDYLEELLDIADIDGDFDIEEGNGRVLIAITSEEEDSNLSKLGDPETVEALQQLTRLAVQAETGEFSRVILDVAGSRDARRAELAVLVNSAFEKLEAGAATAALPPMSSYERKIVHDLAAEKGLTSESEGEGRDRHPILRRA